jgi:hypothetical protein
VIALVPMTESEYEVYLEQSVEEYAREHVRAGRWSEEEASDEARRELQAVLPQGVRTPGQYLSLITDEQLQKRVGVLWFAVRTRAGRQEAFVCDIVIFEEFRRHGYARQVFARLGRASQATGGNLDQPACLWAQCCRTPALREVGVYGYQHPDDEEVGARVSAMFLHGKAAIIEEDRRPPELVHDKASWNYWLIHTLLYSSKEHTCKKNGRRKALCRACRFKSPGPGSSFMDAKTLRIETGRRAIVDPCSSMPVKQDVSPFIK